MADWTWIATAALSVTAHAASLAWLPHEAPPKALEEELPFSLTEIPVEPAEAEPEPPPEEPEVPAAVPTNATRSPGPQREATGPPPAGDATSPAEAGQVMTAGSDDGAPEVADFTMVQGDAGQYAGGVTSRRGRSKKAVSKVGDPTAKPSPSSGPVGGGRAPATDRSRPARPASRAWSCSHLFPAAADAADVHHALVTVVVKVGPSGAPQGVTVVSDPGHGFGSAARSCALGQRYQVALDRSGKPIDGYTAPFSVRFIR